MTITGPDFVALQVRDLDKAAAFYENVVGIARAPFSPPHAAVFATQPAFAVREAAPGVDLESGPLGLGVALWMHDPEATALHATLAAAGGGDSAGAFRGSLRRDLRVRRPRWLRGDGARSQVAGLTREGPVDDRALSAMA